LRIDGINVVRLDLTVSVQIAATAADCVAVAVAASVHRSVKVTTSASYRVVLGGLVGDHLRYRDAGCFCGDDDGDDGEFPLAGRAAGNPVSSRLGEPIKRTCERWRKQATGICGKVERVFVQVNPMPLSGALVIRTDEVTRIEQARPRLSGDLL
jgi:hypothetical protein